MYYYKNDVLLKKLFTSVISTIFLELRNREKCENLL
jgi:hypothetical protein